MEHRNTTGAVERRTIAVEFRADENTTGGKLIVGHAAMFNQSEEIWPGVFEEVAPGAFSKTINEADVKALFNHDPNFVLGRNRAGTLRLSQDDIGLAYEIDVPDTTWANDLYTSLKRGDISQSSYAFVPVKEEWTIGDDGTERRRLLEVQLYDVSPVTYPAFPSTDSQARGMLTAAGFDPDGLARLFLKQQRGAPFTGGERAMLKAVIESLTAMAATTEPVITGHSAGPTHDSAGALKMAQARLRLALAS